MKKVALFLVFAGFMTAGLTAQDKDQVKLKLQDGSCLVVDDSQFVSNDKVKLQDGTCVDINNIWGTTADKDQIRLRDGSCLNIDKVGKVADKDRLHDDSCLVENGILNNFKRLFGKFKR